MSEKPSKSLDKPKSFSAEEKKKRFIKEYLISFNAADAAAKAGYSKKTAKDAGARLLSDANIKRQIEVQSAKRLEKQEVTGERIIAELAKIAFIQEHDVNLPYSTRDKMKALELLGKWRELALWQDKVELTRGVDQKPEEYQKLLHDVRVIYRSIKLERK